MAINIPFAVVSNGNVLERSLSGNMFSLSGVTYGHFLLLTSKTPKTRSEIRHAQEMLQC